MIYIYINKTQRGNYEIDGYDDETGRDLYKRTYMFYNKRAALKAFREEYEIVGKHAEYIDMNKLSLNYA